MGVNKTALYREHVFAVVIHSSKCSIYGFILTKNTHFWGQVVLPLALMNHHIDLKDVFYSVYYAKSILFLHRRIKWNWINLPFCDLFNCFNIFVSKDTWTVICTELIYFLISTLSFSPTHFRKYMVCLPLYE